MSGQLPIIRKNYGFTLIEAVVSVGILAMIVVFIMAGVTAFLNYTHQDFVYMCLIEAANSGIEQAAANPSSIGQNSTYQCGNLQISVSTQLISGQIPASPPAPNTGQTACGLVESDATYNGQTSSIRDEVCNF
ncbi:MAG: prepilin-type N-terminal cleavage/methylation domain-containing protein [Candidatus Parvarchaeota archaeon]